MSSTSAPSHQKDSNGTVEVSEMDTADEVMDSPPGMTIRSGTKKRRRSPKTSGLTPPDQVETKRRLRTSTPAAKRQKTTEGNLDVEDGDDVEKDEEMEEVQTEEKEKVEEVVMEEVEVVEEAKEEDIQRDKGETTTDMSVPVRDSVAEQQDMVRAASTLTSTIESTKNGNGASINGQAVKQMAPISKLRMPSEYTPGKVPPETARLQPETPYNYREPQRLFQGSETVVQQTAAEATTQETASSVRPLLPPRIQEPVATAEEEIAPESNKFDAKPQEGVPPILMLLQRSIVWFCLLLAVQAYYWPFWVNPILTELMEVSDNSVRYFKKALEVPPEIVPNITTVNKTVYETRNETAIVEVEIEVDGHTNDGNPNIEVMDNLLGMLDDSVTSLDDKISVLKEKIWEMESAMDDKDMMQTNWEESVGSVETELLELLSTEPVGEIDSLVEHAMQQIDDLKSVSGKEISPSLLLVDKVPMWEISPEACSKPKDVTKRDPPLAVEDLEHHRQDLIEMAKRSLTSIISEERLSLAVRDFFRDKINLVVEQNTPEESDELIFGINEETASDAINKRMEVELADGTGKADYASLQSGAEVIRTGKRATSPSLVDSLPLWNRVMARTKLRFYGYGPEAALMPTTPSHALGQCWSFENNAKHKQLRWREAHEKDPSNGEFGTLTIRLSKPIQVGSVMIEHAPHKSRRQGGASAILDFRVIGYVDADASGQPYPLGVFRYDSGGKHPAQEFEVSSEVGGRLMPKYHSITLAIDSNWGAEYACLYRFRVME